ncbi:hypothetical protein DdX_19037 [Ditylenchus destructor]|uniref:Uncharacterized protein n=1 Tax=Ditylenchus destructor TaxID=166010 RepID=A0AAD4MII9_9BILA|nr:hypothetical protein DdX_19037 [Ditylenchus destructor]
MFTQVPRGARDKGEEHTGMGIVGGGRRRGGDARDENAGTLGAAVYTAEKSASMNFKASMTTDRPFAPPGPVDPPLLNNCLALFIVEIFLLLLYGKFENATQQIWWLIFVFCAWQLFDRPPLDGFGNEGDEI